MNRGDLQDWLVGRIAREKGIAVETIDPAEPFITYGLESIDAVGISGELEELLGLELDPSLLYEHVSVAALSVHLAGRTGAAAPARETATQEPIAIVGIGCRFPGAAGPAAFWELLCRGGDAISEVPPDRWPIDAYYDREPLAAGKMNTRWGGFLADVDEFDHAFFGISFAEASAMDPQQRLLMEVAWEALEDAQMPPGTLAGSETGVFVGICHNDFERQHLSALDEVSGFSGTGNALSIAANRISYRFDLKGPSLALDTACSSSLVAVHLAVQSLRRGECRLALAAGVNVLLSPDATVIFSKARMMAADGRCKTFDAAADGYVRGEGAGLVVLKPLAAARRDGDSIYAVIRGSALTQDGRTNGISAPNPGAQEQVLKRAYADAQVAPSSVDYVEAHGTGTKLGDPIELLALGRVVGASRSGRNPCRVGAVKANIGHLEGAAGIAGLIKTTLVLKHRQVPPNAQLKTVNPQIKPVRLGLHLPTSLEALENDLPRAGVSAFGFGGTNCHVVMEAAPLREEPAAAAGAQLVALSAASEKSLEAWTSEFIASLDDAARRASLADVAAAAATGRDHHAHRLSVVATDVDELRAKLAKASNFRPGARAGRGAQHRVAFLFSGQGSQYPGMCRELWRYSPFAASLDHSDRYLGSLLGTSIVAEMLQAESHSRLNDTAIAQPAIAAVQIGLVDLLRSIGVSPAAVIGHSVGEIAAAYAAGVFSRDEALTLAVERGRAMSVAGAGAMLSVSLGVREVEPYLRGTTVEIAAENAETSTVLAGARDELTAVAGRLKDDGVSSQWLPVDYAFHSAQMSGAAHALSAQLDWLAPQPSDIAFYSTVTGARAAPAMLNASYWAEGVRARVRFVEAIGALSEAKCGILLEIGADAILIPMLRRAGDEYLKLATQRRRQAADVAFLETAGKLYDAGLNVQWPSLCNGRRARVRLPAYCWDHSGLLRPERMKQRAPRPAAVPVASGFLAGGAVPLPEDVPYTVWTTTISVADRPWLGDHVIFGSVLAPATLFMELVLEAARDRGHAAMAIADFEILQPLALDREVPSELAVRMNREGTRVEILARPAAGANWMLLASAKLVPGSQDDGGGAVSLTAIQARCLENLPMSVFYDQLAGARLQYGEALRVVREIWRTEGEALVTLDSARTTGDWCLNPLLADGALQAISAAIRDFSLQRGTYLPVGFARLERKGEHAVSRAHVAVRDRTDDLVVADIVLMTASGLPAVRIEGLRLQLVRGGEPRPASAAKPSSGLFLYRDVWEPEPVDAEERAAMRWLVLADKTPSVDAVIAALQAPGDQVVTVRPGAGFTRLGEGEFEIASGRDADIRQLVDALFGLGSKAIDGVVVLWGMGEATPGLPPEMVSICALVKALAFNAVAKAPRLWLLTCGGQSAGDAQQTVNCWQSPLWGLAFAIAFEHPDLRCSRLDLDPDGVPDGRAASLVATFLRSDPRGDQYAQRGGEILGRRLQQFDLESSASVSFKDRGTYVVTGGWGAIGLSVAGGLAARGASHIVLIGRTEPSAVASKQIGVLRTSGAVVETLAVDVGDFAALRDALDHVRQSLPPIRGVFHAAGTIDDAPLVELNAASLMHAFHPKALGAWNLHVLTRADPVEHFVLFSSAAAALGSIGQGAYMAANTFLDALVARRRRESLAGLVVDWGPWAEAGMAVEGVLRGRGSSAVAGINMIDHAAGVAALLSLMAQGHERAIVLPYDLKNLIHVYPAAMGIGLFARLFGDDFHQLRNDGSANVVSSRPALSEPYVEPRNRLESVIAGIWQRALGIDQIGVRDPFFELGGDSVFAGQVLTQINRALGVTLDTERAFEELTVERLALLAEEALLDRVETMSEAEASEHLAEV